MLNKKAFAALSVAAISLYSTTALSANNSELDAIRQEIKQMKEFYESKIDALENKLSKLEGRQEQTSKQVAKVKSDLPDIISDSNGVSNDSGRNVYDNSFNPSIGIVLNGQYGMRSESFGEINGFAIGEEGETFEEGFNVEHTELNFSANVDDKFRGSMTAAIAEHGGTTEVELEEAYFETLPGFGLPQGLIVKGGRALWDFGYLNSHHTHADDFADRPLPYRAYLDGAFNDDGAQVSYVLPTNFYSEIGGGYFKGNDFPSGGARGSDADTYSAFVRAGGDVGENISFRIGASALWGEEVSREGNHGEITFDGKSNLFALDFRSVFETSTEQEFILQGEYFWRDEKGTYTIDADTIAPIPDTFDDSTKGWYAQAIYKFNNNWRAGYRYSTLSTAAPATLHIGSELDSNNYNPEIHSVMVDWTNSEFSRIRAQYNRDETYDGQEDDQFMLQYIMSLGAHGAHKY